MQDAAYPGERWLPIEGFEGRYEVSNYGRLRALFPARNRSLPVPRLRKASSDNDGYQITSLSRGDGSIRQVKMHRLVLEAFVGPAPAKHQCRHLNGNPADNRLENLRWGTVKRNHADKVAHGTTSRGERNVKAKLDANNVRRMREHIHAGESPAAIAEQFGVSRSTVYHVASRNTWGWLDLEPPPEPGTQLRLLAA